MKVKTKKIITLITSPIVAHDKLTKIWPITGERLGTSGFIAMFKPFFKHRLKPWSSIEVKTFHTIYIHLTFTR